MKLNKIQTILTAALVTFAFGPLAVTAQDQNANKSKTGEEMKQGSSEMGKAGKSLGHNVKHGRVARGGKHFGKHAYRGGKHITKGTAEAGKKTGSAIKKAVTP